MSARARALIRRVRRSPRLNRAATSAAMSVARLERRSADWLERHALPTGRIELSLPDGSSFAMMTSGDDALAGRLRWHGVMSYETETMREWWRHAQRARHVVDVGANIGIFSLVAAMAPGRPNVWAFEPLPTTAAALRRNAAANPTASVRVIEAALGDRVGTATLHWNERETTDLMASTLPAHPVDDRTTGTVEVAATTLDEWASANGIQRVDLVKIDVEGAEPQVLAGMRQLLARDRPTIFMEVLDETSAMAAQEVADRFDYTHYLLTPSGPVSTKPVEANRMSLNHLLIASP